MTMRTLNKTLVIAALLSIGMFLVYAQEVDPVAKWATIAAYEYKEFPNLVYGKAHNVDLKLDVTMTGPKDKPRPTLICVHGGGWVAFTKDDFRLWMLPMLTADMSLVNVDYRLASVSRAPAGVKDCRWALRWVWQHATDYGFDTNRIVVEGHSAGGHLALMTGMFSPQAGFDSDCPEKEDLKVAAIVNYFGITDVPDVLEGPHQQTYALMWFDRLSDRLDWARKLSPLTYVHPGQPPVVTLQGDKDTTVPYEQGVRLHEALDRAVLPNQRVTNPGGGRGGWSHAENLRGQQAVLQFLHEHRIL
jgi:acetyl esterase/lipase